jgi:hypothetical protein
MLKSNIQNTFAFKLRSQHAITLITINLSRASWHGCCLKGLNKKNKMTKTHLMIAAAIVAVGFTACSNANTEGKQDAEVLTTYVDSVDKLAPVYTVENWTAIDNGYQERALKAEAAIASLEAEDKAKAEASKVKYAALKAKYELKLKENEAAATMQASTSTPNFRKVLRDRLFGEGKIGDDMKFAYVTGDNILSVYQNFVDVVADSKNKFTREDWDEINVLYEALDTRKNAVEKDLATKDNLKIAGLKIKYAAINSTHRGGTKVKENTEAKQ